jgi:hypothetical protein
MTSVNRVGPLENRDRLGIIGAAFGPRGNQGF